MEQTSHLPPRELFQVRLKNPGNSPKFSTPPTPGRDPVRKRTSKGSIPRPLLRRSQVDLRRERGEVPDVGFSYTPKTRSRQGPKGPNPEVRPCSHSVPVGSNSSTSETPDVGSVSRLRSRHTTTGTRSWCQIRVHTWATAVVPVPTLTF